MVREWNLEGMSRQQMLDELAYQDQQVRHIIQKLTGMQLKRQQGTKKYAQLQEIRRDRERDLDSLAVQIDGEGATVVELLGGYYDD